jgi:hypothetical protein
MASDNTEPVCPSLQGSFSKLSADHFSIIVTFLDNQDIRAARLAGRELHFFLSPYLFKSIRFAPQRRRINILEKISRNPVLSRNVRTLRYDVGIFQLEESASFEARQRAINKDLSRVLLSFPALSTVVFVDTVAKFQSENSRSIERDARSRLTIRSYQFLDLVKAVTNSRSRITKIDIEGYWIRCPYKDNAGWGDASGFPSSINNAFPDFIDTRYTEEIVSPFYNPISCPKSRKWHLYF